MQLKYSVLVPVFGACSIAWAIAQESNFLDLTQDAPPRRERGSISGGISRPLSPTAGPRVTYEQPVRVVLTSLDATSYRLEQDAIVWEMEIENILDEPLVIPWSIDYDRIKPADDTYPPGYIESLVGLRIRDVGLVAGEVVFASDLVPTSFKTLMPGESVRIRGSSLLYIASRNVSDQLRTQLPLTVEILGSYWLIDSPMDGGQYSPAVSESGITIEITN